MKRAKKSLSQNFINDKNICNKILNQVTIRDKKIIEIGPGYGFLTDLIIKRNPSNLLLIEKDNQLCNLLREKYKKLKNIYIQNIDAIDFDYKTYKNQIIISNLPYNQSSKIILNFFKYNQNINEMVFLIQKEMALKFDYSLKKMNKYKFITRIYSNYKRCFDVPPTVFKPRPKVNSTVVKFILKRKIIDQNKLNKFCQNIFINKRKKIASKIPNDKRFVGLDLNKRIDEIDLDDLLNIYDLF